MNTRLLSITLLSFFFSFLGFSQSQSDDLKLPQVIPPSPNTASLGKYGEIPIGLFTGSPQIGIPLHEFKTQNLSVPITLRYSSNGVRVDEYASNVGMGWDLSAGGVITRQVNDDPDKNPQSIMPDIETQLITEAMYDFLVLQSFGNGIPGSLDTQPDVYSFNFNGYSGRFYLDTNSTSITSRTPILFEPSPLIIEVVGGGGSLSSFKITDPQGIIYTFSDIENSMSRSSCYTVLAEYANYKITNAWHLSEIEHPNGDIIEFVYDLKSIVFDNGFSQSVTRKDALLDSGGPCDDAISDSPCLSSSSNISPYLKEINAIGFGKVTFSYSQKTGMPTNMDKLDTISVYDENTDLIKEYVFEYEMYAATGYGNPLIPAPLIQDYHSKRFFLKKVTEKSKTGTLKPAHEFEYYDPGSLPTRFSGPQDYWGYYNGESNVNLIDTKTIESIAGNYVLANGLNTFQAADRNPNFIYGIKGLLKKVVYPTGGHNELYYDPHSYPGMETVMPLITTQTATVHKFTASGSVFDEFTTSILTFDQDADLQFIVDMDEMLGGLGDPEETADPLTFLVDVKDAATNQYASIYERNNGFEFARPNPFTVTTSNFSKDYFVRLEAGHSYKVKVTVSRDDTTGTSKLYYYATNGTLTPTNIEVGGLRIAKVETSDGNGDLQTKNYHYGTLDNLTESSGKVVNRNSDPTVIQNGFWFSNTEYCTSTTLSSNSAFPIYGTYHIGYASVIEERGADFSGGGTTNVFRTSYTGFIPNVALGNYIPGTSLSNFFGFGQELEKSAFKKVGNDYKTLSKIENIYKYDLQLDKEITAYNTRARVNIGNYSPISTLTSRIGRFDITGFTMKRQWHYLEKTTNTQYDQDGLNPVATTTNYYYDNPEHLQVSRTKNTVSDDDPIITKIYYPDDVTDVTSLGLDDLNTSIELAAISILKNLNIVAEPVQVESYKDLDNDDFGDANELLSVRRTNYKEWYTNKVWPEYIQTLKGVYNSSTNTLEDRLTFHSYYSNGNIKEASPANGAHSVYIWGYNESLPITKIENVTYGQVSSQVANLQTKSDADNDRTIGPIGLEGDLRTALTALRTSLPQAMVTTYTYDPLIGITSITDPKGNITYYEYDEFNRLWQVKDSDGKILSENQYHYKN